MHRIAPLGEALESRTHVVAECEPFKEKWDVLEGEMRDLNEGGVKSFDASERREKMIATLGDRKMVATDGEPRRGQTIFD